MIDSHCHLDRLSLKPEESLEDLLQQAAMADVTGFLNVCIDLENYPKIVALAERDSRIWATVGVHPNEMEQQEPDFDALYQRALHPRVVAVGETGLDYHYIRADSELQRQRDRFRLHVEVARKVGKPLVVHTREARAETMALLQHCFTETEEMAKQSLDMGFYISFSGIVTFRSAEALRQVVRMVPEDRLLIETDSPYLAPVPHRGKPNQPAYVHLVAEQVAALRGWSLERLDRITTENFFRLFGVGSSPS